VSVTYHEVEQRSEAWQTLRLGRLTASRASDMLATIKNGEAASRRNLRLQLVLERLTGRSHERGFQSQAMQDGIERELAAVARYDALMGGLTQAVGFVSHNELMAGCSPDGFVSDDRIVSIKCPIPATHLDYLRSGTIPREYFSQLLQECWLTGRRRCDFFSYNPDFADLGLDWKLVQFTVTDDEVAVYAKQAIAFLQEVDREVNAVRTMADTAKALRDSVVVA
jgi:exodeoxyribonuclease (lambda-induced)